MFATTVALAVVQVVVDGLYCATLVLVVARVRPWLSQVSVRRRFERTLAVVLVAVGVELAADSR